MNLSGNHLRKNILTGQWVIYSPLRAQRPGRPERQKFEAIENLPQKDSLCPFCPGNETMVPKIIFELKQEQNNGWFTRVVPNKYPALTTEESIKGDSKNIYLTATAFGRHEVIIESPFHNQDIPQMSQEQVVNILKTYKQRYRFLRSKFKDIMNIIIFRNHGPASGTSLVHPHSQMIGTAIIPRYIHDRETIAGTYFEKKGRCSLCDIIEFEMQVRERDIFENESFLGFVPFASEVPFEVWIAPKRHQADFCEIDEHEETDLSKALSDILSAYRDRLDNPDYNYIIHSCTRQNEMTPYLHWYVQIRPRITTPAGFEIGSGVHINVSLPEEDARILKNR
jgi:UDPglucose--hexose-1-phosphate uridylyltransferase